MNLKWMLAAAPLFAAFPLSAQTVAPARAPTISAEQMMRHIRVLASDEYEGRKPGTESENKTLFYIQSEFEKAGLEPGAGTGWFQPVSLLERRAVSHTIGWTRNGEPLNVDPNDFTLIGSKAQDKIADAPAFFVGHGLVMPALGIDQLAGVDLKNAIVFLWTGQIDGIDKAPDFAERVANIARRGAAAVISIHSDDQSWQNVVSSNKRQIVTLYEKTPAAIQGAVHVRAMAHLLENIGDAHALMSSTSAKAFRPVPLVVRGTYDVTTHVRPFVSHNIIGRLLGTGNGREHVLYLGHWDHLGICRPEGSADRICNGAVDNASGIAMLIEIARNLAVGKRPERDILFMGTTAEEMGLLGAEYFGAHPVAPARSIVAALNIDTVAISDWNEQVAVIGRGMPAMDSLIEETAQELGRQMDPDNDANAFLRRQDGWKLTQAGIPTVMVGGGFSDLIKLQSFLSGPYHKPDDDLGIPIRLEGASQDADLLIALGRKLADPKRYQPPRN